MSEARCLQEIYAPHNACFGCGPSNQQGLRIRSFIEGDRCVATWMPQKQYEAFPGVLNGGIVGALLDCHLNWAGTMHLMKLRGASTPPCTVTSEYSIMLKRPCPTDVPLSLWAKVVATEGDKVTVEGALESQGKVRAVCTATFVAVEPGHPAYNRW